MEKLKNTAGESLIEMLVSMLIICLGMMMLAGAIVSAARLNNRAKAIAKMDFKSNVELNPSRDKVSVEAQAKLDGNILKPVTVTVYKSSDGNVEFYYYE